jgi:hypothetical protein
MLHIVFREMSTQKKNLTARDQALNDATSDQLGEEPGADLIRLRNLTIPGLRLPGRYLGIDDSILQ